MNDRLFAPRAPRLPAWGIDGPLAVALAVVLVGVRMFEAHGLHHALSLGYTLTVLAALAVAGRRRRPLAVFAAYQTGLVLAGEP
jgi:hypothetical protein